MACQEISQMRAEVCQSLQGTVNTWQYNLQAKWGDPRVYEAEQEERLRQDARMVYDMNRRNTALLSDAYSRQSERQRQDHTSRMDSLKRRGYRSAGKRPQSAEATVPHSQTPQPSEQPPPSEPANLQHPSK